MFKPNPTEKNIKSLQSPCSKCGALLKYSPGSQQLTCTYCGQSNQIAASYSPILEYDFNQALRELAEAKPVQDISQIQCNACGAGFKFESSVQAGECPFCGTAIVVSHAEARPITPKSLLPFHIDEAQAQQQFKRWLNSLWFAPNKVNYAAQANTKLTGVYIPYWTFDSATETSYLGARGDIYYVSKNVQYVENGRVINATQQEARINWTPVRGKVTRFFDDVLVGASKSLPRQILDRLEPWDVENLQPYDESYLKGFKSEYYQINLDQGFDEAKVKMDEVILADIVFNIGGDQQRIDQLSTTHNHATYKHCLLPVWSAAFRYQGKSYRFVINGRSGQVQGERPYSYWKITGAVILGLSLALAALVIFERTKQMQHQPVSAPWVRNLPSKPITFP